jgi:hypothetical protein
MNQTPSSCGTHAVRYSPAEIQTQCRKAARGAGLAWGLAEEAGMTARWLASFGLPGPRVLADLLKINDGKPYETLRPTSLDGNWAATGGSLCPLVAGATLSDIVAELVAGRRVNLAAVAFPILLLPFLGLAARRYGVALELSCNGVRVTCLPGGISIDGDVALLQTEDARHVVCACVAMVDPTHSPSAQSTAIDASTWATLEYFAHKTYVPATEASRAGAGSAMSDNL